MVWGGGDKPSLKYHTGDSGQTTPCERRVNLRENNPLRRTNEVGGGGYGNWFADCWRMMSREKGNDPGAFSHCKMDPGI